MVSKRRERVEELLFHAKFNEQTVATGVDIVSFAFHFTLAEQNNRAVFRRNWRGQVQATGAGGISFTRFSFDAPSTTAPPFL